jgi:hypothetical protein
VARLTKTETKGTDLTDGALSLRAKGELSMRKVVSVLVGAMLAMAVAMPAYSPAIANADKKIKIINETRHKIVRFYASRVGTDDWEEDILGEDVLGIGQSVTINFGGADFCMYDFKAVFDDGDTLVKERVNVCELDNYRYSED